MSQTTSTRWISSLICFASVPKYKHYRELAAEEFRDVLRRYYTGMSDADFDLVRDEIIDDFIAVNHGLLSTNNYNGKTDFEKADRLTRTWAKIIRANNIKLNLLFDAYAEF